MDLSINYTNALGNKYKNSGSSFSPKKVPIKSNMATVYKDKNDRLYISFKKPVTLDVDGHKIKDVSCYDVKNYTDKATNNGKYYSIDTPESRISLFTHDNKFATMVERFRDEKTMDMNGKKSTGTLEKYTFADGKQKYEMFTNNYKHRIMSLDANGNIITKTKKSVTSGIAQQLMKGIKKLSKLLKF